MQPCSRAANARLQGKKDPGVKQFAYITLLEHHIFHPGAPRNLLRPSGRSYCGAWQRIVTAVHTRPFILSTSPCAHTCCERHACQCAPPKHGGCGLPGGSGAEGAGRAEQDAHLDGGLGLVGKAKKQDGDSEHRGDVVGDLPRLPLMGLGRLPTRQKASQRPGPQRGEGGKGGGIR